MISNKVVTVGVIGLGGMSNFYLRNISKIDSIQVGAICDINQDLLSKIGEQEGVSQEKRFNNMEEIIASPDVDAIISVVPNNLHAKVLELCILHQKPIMSEKPFTMDLEEAENLNLLYEKNPIPCMIGFIHRYTPAFQYAKKLLDENTIGQIRHIDVRYQQSFGAPLFNFPYLWRFNKAVTGTGALGDLGAHMIDSARFFAGEFHSVSALMKTFVEKRIDPLTGEERQVEVDDFTSFQAVLGKGVAGNFVTTRNAIGSSNQHEVTLYGDYGTLHVNIERPNEIDIFVKSESEEKPVLKTEKVPEIYNKTLLSDFAQLILNNKTLDIPTFYDGYKNQKVIDRIIYSAENGRFVKVD
ncbi:Gfo/Idh/MocA family protein [Metabacillus arenae]|uniref:Gfo/Idh/MocA family oxidoreductase n=1 Tax=Metabacillus arenae TaxID=2771434 RepID=A0A926NJ75_9BACI|nr:Gfo/Idh/MocA family oxidoreductase [Metabacillus arenae]MBD1381538.1 Gfo/Idh/MocA family oxidoreductase [Metabacillus arenae]